MTITQEEDLRRVALWESGWVFLAQTTVLYRVLSSIESDHHSLQAWITRERVGLELWVPAWASYAQAYHSDLLATALVAQSRDLQDALMAVVHSVTVFDRRGSRTIDREGGAAIHQFLQQRVIEARP